MKSDNRPMLDIDSWQLTVQLLSKLRLQEDYHVQIDNDKPAQEINPDMFYLFDVWIVHMTGKSMKSIYSKWTEKNIIEYIMEQYVKYQPRMMLVKNNRF